MKILFIMIFIASLFLGSACTSDDLKEDSSEVPDWDYSNAVGDENIGKNDNSDEIEGDNQTYPDNNYENNDNQNENPDNSNEIEKGCGNEKVEYEERCDSNAPLTCSSLNPNMKGVTYCMFNCQGYDMQSCDITNKSWGLLNLRFKTGYILDESKLSDSSYFVKGILPYAAFNGIYDNPLNFFPGLEENVSFAVTNNYQTQLGGNKRQLFIMQNPVVVGGTPGYPRHELEFSPGTIKKGSEYRINSVTIFELMDNLLKLVRYRLIDKKNGVECVAGMGYSGSVFVNDIFPDNADLFDGGSIEVVANNVDFFHPSDFPGLDENNPEIPAEILKYPVCEK